MPLHTRVLFFTADDILAVVCPAGTSKGNTSLASAQDTATQNVYHHPLQGKWLVFLEKGMPAARRRRKATGLSY
jgi:hypothetical protein